MAAHPAQDAGLPAPQLSPGSFLGLGIRAIKNSLMEQRSAELAGHRAFAKQRDHTLFLNYKVMQWETTNASFSMYMISVLPSVNFAKNPCMSILCHTPDGVKMKRWKMRGFI